ncbi:hypothetical protein THMIRHAS_15750 [Thiosulfatimonas sediminis]|uniref:Uncharacterized protein n=1 Tax=Thiosulfatimonas sediminis TaxID=2675054 RepID=A0A6F8PVM4_9GAMM|nr:DUF6172 family protein [Thiosulfatimonas sediminis]BBP46202.1 hypothetical protein THMIRHAS_15750 [Thiosulfatimonas sediminis]
MKKTFILTSEKIATPRLVEAIKHEVRKYLKRERAKTLPAGMNAWDFDCRFGADQESSEAILVTEINQSINHAEQSQMAKFYLEILARPVFKEKAVSHKTGILQHKTDEDEDEFDYEQ